MLKSIIRPQTLIIQPAFIMNQTASIPSLDKINSLQLDNPFWQCSLHLWKNEALRSTLLDLQDKQGQRINLLLFAMWLGLENKLIEPHLEAIETATLAWHDQIVSPLRQIRKNLPKHALRTKIQESELKAEQIEQALLFDLSKNITANVSNEPIDTLIANLFASRLPETHLLLCIQVCLSTFSDNDIQSYISKHKNS